MISLLTRTTFRSFHPGRPVLSLKPRFKMRKGSFSSEQDSTRLISLTKTSVHSTTQRIPYKELGDKIAQVQNVCDVQGWDECTFKFIEPTPDSPIKCGRLEITAGCSLCQLWRGNDLVAVVDMKGNLSVTTLLLAAKQWRQSRHKEATKDLPCLSSSLRNTTWAIYVVILDADDISVLSFTGNADAIAGALGPRPNDPRE